MTGKIRSWMRRSLGQILEQPGIFFGVIIVGAVGLVAGIRGIEALSINARERSREISREVLYSQAEKIADTDGDGILSPDEKARMYIDIQTENLTTEQLRRYINTHQTQNY